MKSKIYTAYSTTQLFALGLQIGVGNIRMATPSHDQVQGARNGVIDLWVSIENESETPEKITFRKLEEKQYRGYSIKVLDMGVDQRGEFVEIEITQP